MHKLLPILSFLLLLVWACQDKPTQNDEIEAEVQDSIGQEITDTTVEPQDFTRQKQDSIEQKIPDTTEIKISEPLLILEDLDSNTLYKWIGPRTKADELDTFEVLGRHVREFYLDSNSFTLRSIYILMDGYGNDTVIEDPDVVYINYGENKLVDYIPVPDLSFDTAAIIAFFDTVVIDPCSEVSLPGIRGHWQKAVNLPENLRYDANTIQAQSCGGGGQDSIIGFAKDIDALKAEDSQGYSLFMEIKEKDGCALGKTTYSVCGLPPGYYVNAPVAINGSRNTLQAFYDFVAPEGPVEWELELSNQLGVKSTLNLSTVFKTSN
ncbi:MAG: hypothetical protein GX801_04835 [Fibrobacter sp.]|nr:hypothetical protein [Fibrobacter sp.]